MGTSDKVNPRFTKETKVVKSSNENDQLDDDDSDDDSLDIFKVKGKKDPKLEVVIVPVQRNLSLVQKKRKVLKRRRRKL